MEVSVFNKSGISDQALLSVRAGGVRKQAAISCGKPFRFQEAGEDTDVLEIGLLEPVANTHIAYRPGQQCYLVRFPASDGCERFCELTVARPEPQAGTAKDDTSPSNDRGAAVEAKDYLEAHGLPSFLQAVLRATVRERPKDPFAFIGQQFLAGFSEAEPGSKSTRAPSGPGADSVFSPSRARELATATDEDILQRASSAVFNDETMAKLLPPDVHQRFKRSIVTREPLPAEDKAAVAHTIFQWARDLGAIDSAHWFFPSRGGGGAVGGTLGALKVDTLIDLVWSSQEASKPFRAGLPPSRLFQGETDGASFPNGGMQETHMSNAVTAWDRSSPPFVLDQVLRIPCSFVTQLGLTLDEKTPLLRSEEAVRRQGMRLLKAVGLDGGVDHIYSCLGWEQEFYVVPADLFLRRPDLVNCGRTLFGKSPSRNQQAGLNYFGPVPRRVDQLLRRVRDEMLCIGCPMLVRHNEYGPGQHEMSPIYSASSPAADSNVIFMEICQREASNLGLAVLFHEKPFRGIDGSGKHCNWSLGTNTGLAFFHAGKTEAELRLFLASVACVVHGLAQYNELVRGTTATAGNDLRLGATEGAPPPIVSLYLGHNLEAHIDRIIEHGDLESYPTPKDCQGIDDKEASAEFRNRSLPFTFQGNRFEFRMVGSSQNCALPVAICNTICAAGMAHLAGLVDSGASLRDAVAETLKGSRHVIFSGDGASPEWHEEANKRGLPVLDSAEKAIAAWTMEKNVKLLDSMGVLTRRESEARAHFLYENLAVELTVEAETLIHMLDTGIIPACARDLSLYKDFPPAHELREDLYRRIFAEGQQLKRIFARLDEMEAEAWEERSQHLCSEVRPQMEKVRQLAEQAEGLIDASIYPYPSLESLLYSHHH